MVADKSSIFSHLFSLENISAFFIITNTNYIFTFIFAIGRLLTFQGCVLTIIFLLAGLATECLVFINLLSRSTIALQKNNS